MLFGKFPSQRDSIFRVENQFPSVFSRDILREQRNARIAQELFRKLCVPGSTRLQRIRRKRTRSTKEFCLQMLDLASQRQKLVQQSRIGDVSITQAVGPAVGTFGEQIMIHAANLLAPIPKA